MRGDGLKRVFSFDSFVLKRRWLFFAIAFLAIVAIFLYALSAYYSPGTPINALDKTKTLASYVSEKNELILLLSGGQLNEEETGIAEARLRLLSFYIDSGTVSSDYVKATSLSSLGSPYQGVSFAVKALGLSFPFMAVYVPFVHWQFVVSHGSFGSKNVLMSPTAPKTDFLGNSLYITALTMIPIILFAAMGSAGLGGSEALILCDGPSGYYAISVSLLLLSFLLSLVVFSLLMAAMSFAAALFFKKDYAAYASPALVCVFFLTLFSIMSVKSPSLDSLSETGLSAYFPILSLYRLSLYPTSWGYWVSLSAHLLVAMAIMFLSCKAYSNRGYRL